MAGIPPNISASQLYPRKIALELDILIENQQISHVYAPYFNYTVSRNERLQKNKRQATPLIPYLAMRYTYACFFWPRCLRDQHRYKPLPIQLRKLLFDLPVIYVIPITSEFSYLLFCKLWEKRAYNSRKISIFSSHQYKEHYSISPLA